MSSNLVRISKFLSLVLRHDPARIGLTLDPQGWASVSELLSLAKAAGRPISRATLERVVRENDKQRFILSDDGARIRANQGHSVRVDLDLAPSEPPEVLYHGTAERSVAAIRLAGLLPRSRQHVHLSKDVDTATRVGARHGRPVVLEVAALSMYRAGHTFYLSANGVWLTERVPAEFLGFPRRDGEA